MRTFTFNLFVPVACVEPIQEGRVLQLKHPYNNAFGIFAIAFSLILLLTTGCQTEDAVQSGLSSETRKAFETLQKTTVFFGHQSVGTNILTGIEQIAGKLGKRATIMTVDESSSIMPHEPTFVHEYIGRNFRPIEKIQDFTRSIETRKARDPDIAFMKFCYLDSQGETPIEQTFQSYVTAMEELEAAHPEITFVYVTMPLTSPQRNLKARVKRLFGMSVRGYQDNAVRHEFNSRLRSAKGDTGRLFDLAQAEATQPDGTAFTVTVDETDYEALFPNYTYDGGHLTNTASVIVAEEFIQFLAQL